MTCRIEKILIANRGEIACRVIRSARERGIATVAVHSEADRDALHVELADEAVEIGPAPVAESYLQAARIIAAAKSTGADAIHPGYGFLSENAGFARDVAAAGLVFIGPSPEAIAAMGDKAESKRRMIAAGVPCVPGYQGDDQSEATLLDEARKIGFPVMLKASAGGGGRGMRIVEDEASFAQLLKLAKSEAQNAFGDDRMLVEKAVIRPRHVEIQVFGDRQGNVVYLAERDCSIQRRHQKVIEEAPSPAVTGAIREAMGAAAVTAAKALGYEGAGTVEFLLDGDGNFYFLEMNTRLQVEHPVTEMITGLDLVSMQIDVAEGLPLAIGQADVTISGHAMEARLYAEDPASDFMPQTGPVELWQAPEGPGVRVDHGIRSGGEVSAFYDPMLAKIIAWGETREEARLRLASALAHTRLFGVVTNRDFLIETLKTPAFARGEATTGFIDENFGAGFEGAAPPVALLTALAAAWFCRGATWRNNRWAEFRLRLSLDDGEPGWVTLRGASGAFELHDGAGEALRIEVLSTGGGVMRFRAGGVVQSLPYHASDERIAFDVDARQHVVRDLTMQPPAALGQDEVDGTVRAPITGTVVSVDVAAGQVVERGQVLATLEAMKMQHMVMAPVPGVIATVAIAAGMQIAAREIVVEINEEDAA